MMPMSEPELDEWEGKIVTQIEFYFSDQNLPGDKFLCEQLRAAEATGHPNTIPLVVVASFRKVKKLLKGRCTPKGPHPVEVLATVLKKGSSALFVVGGQHESGDERGGGGEEEGPGNENAAASGSSANSSSSSSSSSPSSYRVGRVAPLPKELFDAVEHAAMRAELQMRTVVANCLPAHSTIDSVTATFSSCGEVVAVRMPSLQDGDDGSSGSSSSSSGDPSSSARLRAGAGANTVAEIEYATYEGAFAAVDKLTDTSNWRGGLRVLLSNGLSLSAARRHLEKGNALPHAVPVDDQNNNSGGEGADTGGGGEAGPPPPPPEGRQSGKIAFAKGPFGFIEPADATQKKKQKKPQSNRQKKKDNSDNLYFSTKSVRGLKQVLKKRLLKHGSDVKYTVVVNEDTGKWVAVDVEFVEKDHLSSSEEAGGGGDAEGTEGGGGEGGVAAAEAIGATAGEDSSAATAALMNSLLAGGAAGDAAGCADAATEQPPKPERRRIMLAPKAYKEAKGPDGTLGFAVGWRPSVAAAVAEETTEEATEGGGDDDEE